MVHDLCSYWRFHDLAVIEVFMVNFTDYWWLCWHKANKCSYWSFSILQIIDDLCKLTIAVIEVFHDLCKLTIAAIEVFHCKFHRLLMISVDTKLTNGVIEISQFHRLLMIYVN